MKTEFQKLDFLPEKILRTRWIGYEFSADFRPRAA